MSAVGIEPATILGSTQVLFRQGTNFRVASVAADWLAYSDLQLSVEFSRPPRRRGMAALCASACTASSSHDGNPQAITAASKRLGSDPARLRRPRPPSYGHAWGAKAGRGRGAGLRRGQRAAKLKWPSWAIRGSFGRSAAADEIVKRRSPVQHEKRDPAILRTEELDIREKFGLLEDRPLHDVTSRREPAAMSCPAQRAAG